MAKDNKKKKKNNNIKKEEKNVVKETNNSNIQTKEVKKEKNKKQIVINIDKEKILKGLGVIVLVLSIVGLSFWASKSYSGDTKTFEFNNITIDEYLDLMAGSEKSIIYIARPNCSYCQMETPILKKVAKKYNLEVNYLDTTDFIDYENKTYTEDGFKFLNSAEIYNDGFGTPNTIVVQNGGIVDGVYQYVEADELEALFERTGYIK